MHAHTISMMGRRGALLLSPLIPFLCLRLCRPPPSLGVAKMCLLRLAAPLSAPLTQSHTVTHRKEESGTRADRQGVGRVLQICQLPLPSSSIIQLTPR